MEFCIAVAYTDPRELCEIARVAEEAGFGAIVISDHLFYPKELGTRYPYTPDGKPYWLPETPWPDPFVAIGAMAAVTERLRFITSVFLLPLRHPVLAAKTVSTAAVMSDDRVTVGLGVGWMREEFELVGIPFEKRGRILDEAIDVMRTLWRGGMVEHHGEFFDFDPLEMSPVPSKPVPMYGGGLSERALRRAGSRLDGWVGMIQSSSEIGEVIAKLRAYRADSPLAGEPLGVCGTATDASNLDGYRRIAEIGVTEVVTVPWLFYGADWSSSCQEKCDGLRRFGDQVIAKLD